MKTVSKVMTATFAGVSLLAAVAGPAHAAGIVFLPSARNSFKTVSRISRSQPGEFVAHADMQVVNWGSLDTIECVMWTDARESGGSSMPRIVSRDSVSIGVGSQDFDSDISLDAVIDSTRRFKVWVRCAHLDVGGQRPYVEPGAITIVDRNS
jgi:hypothetical protein